MTTTRHSSFLLLVAALASCESPTPETSSSSHWVACKDTSGCTSVSGAVACSAGYCVDSNGNRITTSGSDASGAGGEDSGGASAGGTSTGGTNAGGTNAGGATAGGTSAGGVSTGGAAEASDAAAGSTGGGPLIDAAGGYECGTETCIVGQSYCYSLKIGAGPAVPACYPLPAACAASPTCACVCPNINSGICGGGTNSCTCTDLASDVKLTCTGV